MRRYDHYLLGAWILRHPGWHDTDIARVFGVSEQVVWQIRETLQKQF